MIVSLAGAVVALEALCAARAALRMVRTRGGAPVGPGLRGDASARVDVVIPVLNEEQRLGATLDALRACAPGLGEIIIVDGGSVDATPRIVETARRAGMRIRWIDASPVPRGWNGKAWNLEVGMRAAQTPWIAAVDADVRPGPTVLGDALARAQHDGLAALSIATRQRLADRASALLHPAFLTTLVYRYGLPNVAITDPARVLANGQLFVARRDALERTRAIAAARASRSEDVTIARALAASGERVGFYEGDAVVCMHDSWRACWSNWPRSLALRDRFVSPARSALALAELLFAQALPLPTLLLLLAFGDALAFAPLLRAAAFAMVAMRLGVLAGTRRAYVAPAPLYWLSPLLDLPALAAVTLAALRRRHVWRGRTLVVEEPA